MNEDQDIKLTSDDEDVEGHSIRGGLTRTSSESDSATEGFPREDDDDVEGHGFRTSVTRIQHGENRIQHGENRIQHGENRVDE